MFSIFSFRNEIIRIVLGDMGVLIMCTLFMGLGCIIGSSLSVVCRNDLAGHGSVRFSYGWIVGRFQI